MLTRLNPKGVHVAIPLAPFDDAATAIGKDVVEQVFRPMANGKVPVDMEHLGAPSTSWRDFCVWIGRVNDYHEMVNDHHGGW